MELSVETRKEMERVFGACRETIGGFPPPFAESGVRYLDAFDPSRSDGSNNYICYLLPYWLREAAGAKIEDCRRIAEANIFGMLHFHLQDKRMDRREGLDRTHIALSQLLSAEMTLRYSALFRSPARFQDSLRRYTAEWAEGLASERSGDPFFDDPHRVSARSAPLLLCPAVLFETRPEQLAAALRAVRETLVTLQMADDWADYAEDLREGGYNCLVSLHRRELGSGRDAPVDEASVSRAVYAGGLLGRYAELAAGRQAGLEPYRSDFAGLVEFHAALAGDLERIAAGIEAEKQHLSMGGLDYWLLGQKKLF
ncbi:hypothetical protein QWJ34_01780 [Saccharibacillus sp. CPCC 101409]|uniref:hypothetical protein n=1 Tax=Saccharibacillus sp. CPCC 101409 TaxID=3058041 RepID=UPI002673BC48|nr:hypothetical protein [Saccharibacillus sp. CPCC 101409]MDO3408490.1 hypothetical protein [Saccharibacillus sp. CPCC 101409]